MSSSYQPKRKELAKVRVVSTENYSKNRSSLSFVGSVGRSFSNFITTKRNKKTGKCSYVDDTSALTKKTKGDIVRFFSDQGNKRKDVAYLVVPKPTPKSSAKGASKVKRKRT